MDSQALDYLYNRSPGEGSAAGNANDDYQKGKSGAESKQNALESMVASESLISPDFEKFLSSAEVDKVQLARYQELYTQTLDFLNKRKPVEAWQNLILLSQFEWDAGLSKQIANRVRAVWDTNVTAKGLLDQNDKLQAQIRTSNWNADVSADAIRQREEDRAKANGTGKQKGAPTASDAAQSLPGTLQLTEEYFKSLDSKARIKLNEVKVDGIKTKARSDLVDYITTLYKSKRYGHAVLAAEFYQALFVDGELPPEVANQATASLEASRDIARAVDVFRFKAGQKQISAASNILMKAWDTGDTTPEMLGLERNLKVAVIDHANRVRKMKNLIEARNFEGLETVLDEMDKTATDFDTTKPRALIQAIKLESRLRLGKAKLFAQQGDPAKAMEEFKAAAETWPGNPELNKSASEYFTAEDASTKSSTEFDREYAEKNYRAIADKQVQYLAFVQTDEGRKGQFKEALEKVRDAETALEKAKMLDNNGDSAGAWETIELAATAWPEDSKLNQARADYSSKAPEFVSAIRKAQSAEKGNRLGASMSLYALARKNYPASSLAKQGVDRTSQAYLNPPPVKSKEEPAQKKDDISQKPSPVAS